MIMVLFRSDAAAAERQAVYLAAWKHGFRKCPKKQRGLEVVFGRNPNKARHETTKLVDYLCSLPWVRSCQQFKPN